MDQIRRDKLIFGFYFLLIVAISLFVFYPSFAHTFRADQIVYFANTREHSDVFSLCKDYYAYPLVRYYEPGDAFLFRPLVFILIGFEKGVFNMHYAYWHVLGFLLHMLTVWFLFRILYDLKAGMYGFLGALLYSCCYTNVEMVIWEHINGYMLFNALLMGSFFYFKRSFDDVKYQNDIYMASFLLIVCSFLHEWGSLFAVMFAICFYFKNIEAGRLEDNKKTWLFILPGAFYALTYGLVDLHYKSGIFSKNQTDQLAKVTQFPNLLHVVKVVPQFFYHLMYGGLFPSRFEGILNNMDRLVFIDNPMVSTEYLLNLIAVCGVVFLIFQGFSKLVTAHHKFLLLLLTGMTGCILITLPLMRLPTHGVEYVFQISSYYGYMFWSFILVVIFMMVDWSNAKLQSKTPLKYLAVFSLIVLISLNAFQTWKLNQSIKTSRAGLRQYIDEFNNFIVKHGSEKGFSFYVKDDQLIMLTHKIKGSMKEETDQLDLASIFYYPYYNAQNPKYICLRRD